MGTRDILYSDETLRYFEENVYGKGEYDNTIGQSFDLFYQCWLDEVGFFWDGADVINMVISFLGKGWKWLKSAGTDKVAKGISKGDDLISSLGVTYRVTADKVADTQKYRDDVFEQMAARRAGNGQYRFCFAGGYLDDSSRLVYEIHGDAGNTLSQTSRMDGIADPGVVKGLGGTGHPDDVDDILSAAKGLDGIGDELKVDNYVRVNGMVRQHKVGNGKLYMKV